MADTKISALPSATTPLAGTEVLPIVQSSTTVKVPVSDLTAGRAISALSVSSATVGAGSGANLSLQADGATKATLDTSGNIGVGTSPEVIANYTTLTVGNSSSARGVINSYDGTVKASLWTINDSQAWIGSRSNHPIAFSINGAQKMTLGTSGDLSIASGNLVQGTAAKGINFTANAGASGMTSQLLNWYEEGTWTPTFEAETGSGATYTSSGSYTRIGRSVTVTGIVSPTNFGTCSNRVLVGGLPFTSANTIVLGSCYISNITLSVACNIASAIRVLGNYITFWWTANNNGGGDNVRVSNINTNSDLRFTITYFV